MEIKTKEDLDRAIEFHLEMWRYFANVEVETIESIWKNKLSWPGWKEYNINPYSIKHLCFICHILQNLSGVNEYDWGCTGCLIDWPYGGAEKPYACEYLKSPYRNWMLYYTGRCNDLSIILREETLERREFARQVSELPINQKKYDLIVRYLDGSIEFETFWNIIKPGTSLALKGLPETAARIIKRVHN